MDLEQLLPYAIFGVITFGAWAIFNAFAKSSSVVHKRLDELRDPSLRAREGQEKGVGGMMEKAAPTLSRALQPKTEFEASALKVRLANAGFQSPKAPQL